MPFVRRFATWGLASEQPIEVLHKTVNSNTRQLNSARGLMVLFERLMRTSGVRNGLHDANAEEINIAGYNALADMDALVDEDYAGMFEFEVEPEAEEEE